MRMYLSELQHSQLALKYSGRMGDADKADDWTPQRNIHPASSTLHSGFCPLNDASIGPSLTALPFSAAAAFLYIVCSISYFLLSCKIRLLQTGCKKKKLHISVQLQNEFQIIKKWVSPIRTHPWSECNDRTWKSPEISMVLAQQASGFISLDTIIRKIIRHFGK